LQLNQTNFELSHQLSAAQQELASKAKEIDDSESRRKFAEDRLREMRLRDEHVSQRRVVCPLYVVLWCSACLPHAKPVVPPELLRLEQGATAPAAAAAVGLGRSPADCAPPIDRSARVRALSVALYVVFYLSVALCGVCTRCSAAKSRALHTAQVAADIRRDKVNLQELFDAKLRHASARVHLRADARACMLVCVRARLLAWHV
jgi:hypothetical protein